MGVNLFYQLDSLLKPLVLSVWSKVKVRVYNGSHALFWRKHAAVGFLLSSPGVAGSEVQIKLIPCVFNISTKLKFVLILIFDFHFQMCNGQRLKLDRPIEALFT